jgi:signal transduction histidine kinase
MRQRIVACTIVGAAGGAVGIATLASARHDPGGSFAGSSTLGAIAELGAGWALILAGLIFWLRRTNVCGPLLVAAGLAWFLPEWGNPGIGSAAAFSIGLAGFVACPPLVAHAALAYPGGRVGSNVARATLAVGYAGAVGLLGLLPTAVFDPRAQSCLQCPRNLLLVHGDAGAFSTFNDWGIRIGLGWAIGLAAVIGWRIVRSSAAALAVAAPVLVAAGAFLGIVAWDFEHGLDRGILSNDSFDVRLWRYEAAALAALALGVAWGLYRGRRARASVASLVVELGRSPSPGGVRDALAQALGDPQLQLAYRRTDADVYVDAQGRPVELPTSAGRAVTPLLRDGRPVAALAHDAQLLDDPGHFEEVVAAARLAVENERFQAEVRAQLESLRASRARIVETGDTERRRLERDLHDGAQQRLVGLALALRMLRNQVEGDGGEAPTSRLEEAESELREALAELRELAHGIYPAALADEGLAAAVETLAEGAPVPIELGPLPEERFGAPVENAAYFVVAETLRRTRPSRARVDASRTDGRLVIELEAHDAFDEELTDLEDRVGALDGRFSAHNDGTSLRLRAELPCA